MQDSRSSAAVMMHDSELLIRILVVMLFLGAGSLAIFSMDQIWLSPVKALASWLSGSPVMSSQWFESIAFVHIMSGGFSALVGFALCAVSGTNRYGLSAVLFLGLIESLSYWWVSLKVLSLEQFVPGMLASCWTCLVWPGVGGLALGLLALIFFTTIHRDSED